MLMASATDDASSVQSPSREVISRDPVTSPDAARSSICACIW